MLVVVVMVVVIVVVVVVVMVVDVVECLSLIKFCYSRNTFASQSLSNI